MDKPYEFDLYTMFWGEHPPSMLLEILLRVALVYLFILIVLRLGGKRTTGELAFFDFAIIIALGSAVGDAMVMSDVPLFHSFLVVASVVALEQIVARLTERNRSVEAFVEGQPTLLVEDGVISENQMHGERLSRDELFEGLRQNGVHHLGEVALAYLEPSGKLSVIKAKVPRPGLSVLPHGKRLCTDERVQELLSCKTCGTIVDKSDDEQHCPRCGEKKWAKATYCELEGQS